jgi:hypothetical protein
LAQASNNGLSDSSSIRAKAVTKAESERLPTVAEMMRVFALWRYFMWCQMQRDDVDAFKITSETDFFDSIEIQRWFKDLSYWYAGLYVVCEGWQELKLTDPVIDPLLASSYLGVLKRYRNGVFHYQREYFDSRIKEGIQAGEPFEQWVKELMLQFRRYFRDWTDEHRMHIQQLYLAHKAESC